MLYVIIGVATVLIVAFFIFGKEYGKKKTPHVGFLMVDDRDPEEGGGVYLITSIDPKTLQEHERVALQVMKVHKGGTEE